MPVLVAGFTTIGLGVTTLISGVVAEPAEKTNKFLTDIPESVLDLSAKTADIIAGNENREIENFVSNALLVYNTANAIKIITKPKAIWSIIEKLSIRSTIAAWGAVITDLLNENEEDIEWEEVVEDNEEFIIF